MKIYTRTGDDGTTGLIGGRRVKKSALRIEACGTLDELNAMLGVAARLEASLQAQIHAVQNELFDVGAQLATPSQESKGRQIAALSDRSIERLEREIDAAETELPPLKNFILPGGGEAGGLLHLARAVSRRSERIIVSLDEQEAVSKSILIYMNRLSDWLFVMARLANRRAGVEETIWSR